MASRRSLPRSGARLFYQETVVTDAQARDWVSPRRGGALQFGGGAARSVAKGPVGGGVRTAEAIWHRRGNRQRQICTTLPQSRVTTWAAK